MNETSSLRQPQLLAIGALSLLSPALRLFPGSAAALAGRGAWLSALAALPGLLLYLFFLCRFCGKRQPGESLADLVVRAVGPQAGRLMLLLLGAWLVFYSGFHLRAGAERYVLTIFTHSSPAPFVLTVAIISLWAALGPLRSLGRLARLLLTPVFVLLLVLLLSALPKVERSALLPLTVYDLGPMLRGSLPVLEMLALVLYCPCFFLDRAEPIKPRSAAGWLCSLVLLMTLLGAAVLGSFGAALTSELQQPFFTLVRNLVFFRSLERVEALAVSLWLFPDIVMETMLLAAADRCLRKSFGMMPSERGRRRLSLSGGRWLIVLCGAVSAAIGLVLAPDVRSFSRWSEEIIPLASLAAAMLLPLAGLTGKLRKTL